MVLVRQEIGDVLRDFRLQKGRTLRQVASKASVALGYLSEVERGEFGVAAAKLESLPGVGPWTANYVARAALGWTDAVPVGDFHMPSVVSEVLTGTRGDDEAMLEALAPFRPHREPLNALNALNAAPSARARVCILSAQSAPSLHTQRVSARSTPGCAGASGDVGDQHRHPA